MFDLMNPVFAYMGCTLLLGTFFGWAVWGLGSSKKAKILASEVKFWQDKLEQVRRERDLDITSIERSVGKKIP